MKHFLLACTLIILNIGTPVRASEPVSPQSSANLDSSRDISNKSGFLQDTNRTIPILYIVGDSTVHNPSKTERGWGDVISKYFDASKIHVENHALGGRSSRTFITQGWWDKVLKTAKPGDYVLIQMGHNDGGPLDDTNRARGTIRSLSEDTIDIYNPITKQPETVHTYGWYMRKYISDSRKQGLKPILCTPVPHCPKAVVSTGDVESSDYVRMSTEVAKSEQVPFVNINQITMSHYAGMAVSEIKEKYFTPADNTHSSYEGAELNARSVVEGIRQIKELKLVEYLLPEIK